MMAILIFLLATITISSGAKWNDFRGGDVFMPIKLDIAVGSGWIVSEVDDNLKIKWYSKAKNDVLSVAYDKLGNCAGVRVIINEKDIDPHYLSLYKNPTGIFEAVKYKGEVAYKSVVLFTPENFLQKGGRDLKWLGPDELAEFAYLKEAGKYKMLSREICTQAKGNYFEQGCHSNYGLILSHFGGKTVCNKLKPFYTVFNLKEDGDLIGFGWLLFTKGHKMDTFLKHITSDMIKKHFHNSPDCLKSSSNIAAVEVWLSHRESKKVSCIGNSLVDNKLCKGRKVPEKESSSVEESKESSAVEESFWSKWFG